MKPGDTIENAVWVSGSESPGALERYEAMVRESFAAASDEYHIVLGPMRTLVKRPGDDRVPPVPDRITGPDVRLIVYEADVLCRAPEVNTRHFVGDLEPKDLERLREVVRRRAPHLTDLECDDVIEQLGPEAAIATLEVYGKSVH